jgi:putative ABC transport system substrate-binding protein
MRRRNFIKWGAGGPLFASMVLASPGKLFAQARAPTKRVGILIARPEADPEGQRQLAAFERGLEQLGWSRGRNLEMDIRWETDDPAKRLQFVRELVALKPDVMLINSTSYLRVAKPEISDIPTVFVAVTDPVEQGFVQSLARPGGTMTGFGVEEPGMGSKWMELLREIAPATRSVAAIFNPDTAPGARLFLPSLSAVQSSIAVEVTEAPIRDEAELERAIAAAAQRPSPGLIFLPDSFLASRPAQVAALVARHRVPAVYAVSAFPRSGGLIALGIERADIFGRAAGYVDRILRGERPSDLPVQMPSKFELVVNLATAKALGLAIPPTILARADEVIE